jgi:hypothetical protein
MELFTVNPTDNYRRGALIENFESFIWTDRFSAFGDLTLVAQPTLAMRTLLAPDTLVGFDESDRVMQIDSAVRAEDAEGVDKLTIKGRSLEHVLDGRAAKRVLSPATWNITGTVGSIIAEMVNGVCVQGGGISPNDIIPNLSVSYDLLPVTSSYVVSVKAGTLYERVKEICDTFNYGFRITVTPGTNTLWFVVYPGTDRSSRTAVGSVAFSEDLENLSQSSYLVSKENYNTTAYVFSDNGSRIVNATGTEAISGLNRKVILVDATDITTVAGAELNAALDQRGRDSLSAHKVEVLFDGTTNPTGMYRYNIHYFLGDIVALIGDYNIRQPMRVTEHIWSYDTTGYNSYPTLAAVGGV